MRTVPTRRPRTRSNLTALATALAILPSLAAGSAYAQDGLEGGSASEVPGWEQRRVAALTVSDDGTTATVLLTEDSTAVAGAVMGAGILRMPQTELTFPASPELTKLLGNADGKTLPAIAHRGKNSNELILVIALAGEPGARPNAVPGKAEVRLPKVRLTFEFPAVNVDLTKARTNIKWENAKPGNPAGNAAGNPRVRTDSAATPADSSGGRTPKP